MHFAENRAINDFSAACEPRSTLINIYFFIHRLINPTILSLLAFSMIICAIFRALALEMCLKLVRKITRRPLSEENSMYERVNLTTPQYGDDIDQDYEMNLYDRTSVEFKNWIFL